MVNKLIDIEEGRQLTHDQEEIVKREEMIKDQIAMKTSENLRKRIVNAMQYLENLSAMAKKRQREIEAFPSQVYTFLGIDCLIVRYRYYV